MVGSQVLSCEIPEELVALQQTCNSLLVEEEKELGGLQGEDQTMRMMLTLMQAAMIQVLMKTMTWLPF